MSVAPKKNELGKSPAHEKLRKLLLLVPFVSQHPGVGVDDLARKFGVSREELLADLELLTMVGRPPFQPDDYIDVYVENDKVYVDLDQRFRAPPRLTASEAAALAASAALLKPAAEEALAKALEKLERVIPQTAKQRYLEMGKKLDLSLEGPSGLAPLSSAIVERREVEFEYVSVGKGQMETRVVRPLELFCHRGQWYVSAYCCTREDDRLFRIDRMRQVTVTERTFAPRAGRKHVFSDTAESGMEEVKVRFLPHAAHYQKERFGDQAKLLPDGSLEVSVPGDSERWLTQWVLSFGGDAEVVSPPHMRQAVEKAAQRLFQSSSK